jgi:UDP-N-acetylmuramoyl-L-alanyl-D-glutamate--2,6-diaminopimelate ligase
MPKILNIFKKLIPAGIYKKLQPYYHFLVAWIACLVYRNPSKNLIVIGVTGTTGKTTCVYLIAKALEAAGLKTGYTSTAMFNDGVREWLNDKKMTMIGRFFSQKILRNMVTNGCQCAIIETTSEGVMQYRHRFINYDILVFTGLYPEHIESHGSFENYKKAKGRLFAHFKHCSTKYADDKYSISSPASNMKKIEFNRIKKTSIVNGDDDYAQYFLDFWAEKKYFFTAKDCGLVVREGVEKICYGNIKVDQSGTSYDLLTVPENPNLEKIRLNLKLLGDFNATNSMTAVAVGIALRLPLKSLQKGLEGVSGIPGRLENIDERQNFGVIVDYAFEPKAVIKLYETLKLLPHNRIIHVLGATGGGRDVARRPKLGEIAGKNADIVIVTNEDPYDDDPEIIVDQVALGAEKTGKKRDENLFIVLDRRDAIQKAVNIAKEQDIVVITGKGSEQAICVAGGEKIPWDDRAIVRAILNQR